jgi:hypothetical protein
LASLVFLAPAHAADTRSELSAVIASSIGACPPGNPQCISPEVLAGVMQRMVASMATVDEVGNGQVASIAAFQPTPAYGSLSISPSSSSTQLPAGTSVVVYNNGAFDACVALGDATVTAQCPGGDVVKAGGWMSFAVGSATWIAAATQTGLTNLTLSGGSGLAAGAQGSGGGSVTIAGSVGQDVSLNRPAIPLVGSNFSNGGPYANYVLLGAVQANSTRHAIDVENTSGAPIVLVIDDGVASTGFAPANASLVPLAGGGTAGSQGGSWTSYAEKGRVSVYAPSASAFVTMRTD